MAPVKNFGGKKKVIQGAVSWMILQYVFLSEVLQRTWLLLIT